MTVVAAETAVSYLGAGGCFCKRIWFGEQTSATAAMLSGKSGLITKVLERIMEHGEIFVITVDRSIIELCA